MKLDEKYFERKVEIIGKIVNREYLHNGTIGGVLHQIATDAFAAGAGAQMVACVKAINDLVDNCGCCEAPSADIVITAIQSATVEFSYE